MTEVWVDVLPQKDRPRLLSDVVLNFPDDLAGYQTSRSFSPTFVAHRPFTLDTLCWKDGVLVATYLAVYSGIGALLINTVAYTLLVAMEPVSLTACLAAARVTLDIVLQVKHKYEQWSDSSSGIRYLHADILSAKIFLSENIPDIGPRLPFVPVELFNAVTTNFETCQEALSRITDAAKHLKSESRQDRLKVVWNENGLDRQRHHLQDQLRNLRDLIEIVRE